MTRVDFYLLQNPHASDKKHWACRLADKAFALGHKIYILTNSPEETDSLDQLLWIYSAGSFVPHSSFTPGHNPSLENSPVLIGHEEPPPAWHEVLLSLAQQVPVWFSRFERVAEFVGADDQDKLLARERFRFYRDRGYPLETHNL